MPNEQIRDLVDFKCWVRTELVRQNTSQKALAREMKVSYPRLSEAVNGQKSGKKFIVPLIEALGGDPEKFKAITQEVII